MVYCTFLGLVLDMFVYAKLFYLSLAHLITFCAEQKQMESDGNGEGMSRKVSWKIKTA